MATHAAPRRWDIFCTVVDNYGDIGVTWRLARQLAGEFGLEVRLLVDDLASFARIAPRLDPALSEQELAGVQILRWGPEFPALAPAEIVIEAFACALPESYVAAMAALPVPPVWLNLEYLSAEDWVAGCHGLASAHPRLPLTKHFFFPGFTPGTGGLLAERELGARRRAFQADAQAQAAYWAALGIERPAQALTVSLFAYENPGLAGLLAAWAAGTEPVLCLVPEGRVLPEVLGYFGAATGTVGQRLQAGALTVQILPFVAQPDYDRLLWACDLNFVRGEDSFVRAQWAGRPLVWQIYAQEEDAHLLKLEAFLRLYGEDLSSASAAALLAFWQAWNTGGDAGAVWPALRVALAELAIHAESWVGRLNSLGDLASNLVQFCANRYSDGPLN